MPELHVRPFSPPTYQRLRAPLRVQLFGGHARLLHTGYLAGEQPELRWPVEPGDYTIRTTRPSGEVTDAFIDIPPSTEEIPVSVDPGGDSPHEWVADAFGFGVLDFAARPFHAAVHARDLRSPERRVWLRAFRGWLPYQWHVEVSGLAIDEIAPDIARLSLAPASWTRLIQIGGSGTPWQLIVVPSSTWACSLIIATETEGGLFGASPQLFSGDRTREALLRLLAADAPTDPMKLFAAITGNGRALHAEQDEAERLLLLALAGLFALRFNLTESNLGEAASVLAFTEAAEVGRRALETGHWPGPWPRTIAADLLVVAAWEAMRRETGPEFDRARDLLVAATRNELPCFAYALELLHGGLRLLVDAAGGEKTCDDAELLGALGHARRYVEAAVPGRGYTSFFGRSPAEPTVEPLLGEPPYGPPLVTLAFPRNGPSW